MSYLYGHSSAEIGKLQEALEKLGLYHGAIDEGFGDLTLEAVKDAQSAFGLDETGIVDLPLLIELGLEKQKPAPRPNPLTKWLTDLAIKQAVSQLKGLPGMNQVLISTGTGVTGVISVLIGVASLVTIVVPLGAINGFTPLTPGEAINSITYGCGLLFLRRAIAKNGVGQ